MAKGLSDIRDAVNDRVTVEDDGGVAVDAILGNSDEADGGPLCFFDPHGVHLPHSLQGHLAAFGSVGSRSDRMASNRSMPSSA